MTYRRSIETYPTNSLEYLSI